MLLFLILVLKHLRVMFRSSCLEVFCGKKRGPATLLKRDSGTGAFLSILPILKEHFRAAASQCFTHIESSKLMYKTNQWTGFYAGETLFEHD